MDIDSTEISQYVSAVAKGIKEGIGDEFIVADSITIELAIVNEIKGEIDGKAEIKVHVFGVGGKIAGSLSNQQISRITIPILPKLRGQEIADTYITKHAHNKQ